METNNLKLKIKLLSDLCTGSGESYNSLVDIECVYDDYGLPYIPAKRLKGCIREAALELVEFGLYSKEVFVHLFGKEGNAVSAFTVSNAYLKNYQNYVKDLENEKDEVLKHPQNVLGLYTYTRTQTALNAETGTADPTSLRTMRVVKKNLDFESAVCFAKNCGEEERRLLEDAAKLVAHIGIHRTRGLGSVKIETEESEDISANKVMVPAKSEVDAGADTNGRVRLAYTITLNAPMLCKSAEGNQARTQDYIEGGKLLGLIAGAMGMETFKSMSTDELFISNAYITCEGKRCTPLAASLQREKDQKFDEEGQMEVYDLLSGEIPVKQLTSIHAGYMSKDGYVKNVDTEIQYHHRRPEDKSIGRVSGKDDSSFYQLESMRKNQQFTGYILADKDNAWKICKALGTLTDIRMGYARNAEYGEVTLEVCVEAPESREKKIVHDFVLKLNAPAILYNAGGMFSADMDVLKEYLEEELHVPDLEISQAFLKYEPVGGFNVTWKRRKPAALTIGRGSVFKVSSEQGVDISGLDGAFIGERVSEGYGELEVLAEISERTLLRKAEEKPVLGEETNATEIIGELRRVQYEKNLEAEAREKADEIYAAKAKERELEATVAKIILIGRTEKTYAEMEKQVNEIESDSKRKLANAIIQCMDMQGDSKNENAESFRIFTDAYLKHLKYRMRPEREQRRQ